MSVCFYHKIFIRGLTSDLYSVCVLLQFSKMQVSLVILAVFAAFCAVNCEVFYEENFKDGKYTRIDDKSVKV